MRVVAAAILILAGVIGIGTGDVARALGSVGDAPPVTMAGWIVFVLGFALLIIEYVALSPAARNRYQQQEKLE